MGKLTLLTLLHLLQEKNIITDVEAVNIASIQQVEDILKSKGSISEVDINLVSSNHTLIVNTCRTLLLESSGEKRKELSTKLHFLVRKDS